MPLSARIAGAGLTPLSTHFAQERIDIRFKPGATSTTINGTVRGDAYIDYIVNARGGQTMVVSLAVTDTNGHGSAYFNILPAGKDCGGLYTGSSDEDRRAEARAPAERAVSKSLEELRAERQKRTGRRICP